MEDPATHPSEPPASRSSLKRITSTVVTIALFVGAAFLLDHALKNMRLKTFWHDLRQTPDSAVLLALGLTIASHIALTLYDYIGVRYIKAKLGYWHVALAAFVAYAVSHTLGFPAVTGGGVRYRLYSRWGLSAIDVAHVMAMAGITLFLGMFLIGGVTLLGNGEQAALWTGLPHFAVNLLGAAGLVIAIAYLLAGFIRQEPIKIFSLAIDIPKPSFALVQLIVGTVDWLLVASVLYVLLPHTANVSIFDFVGLFVLAYMLGALSNVPAGLGVFESVLLVTLTPAMSAEQVLSSLVVYRGIYNLLPFIIGGVTFFYLELRPAAKTKKKAPPKLGEA